MNLKAITIVESKYKYIIDKIEMNITQQQTPCQADNLNISAILRDIPSKD